ncbi:MBL fold metallo-hydrolase [Marinilabilia sp.]|uniref:MBL fold metallo-hydrolase n=1 Tax=Marinilabilia sp. TaxID=2021252 RepID=UPI0025C33BA0|nr:MBL fold metallo-hydrolase [Marinilabilia sp.]
MEVQIIRNATVKIKYGGKIWLVDPFLGDVNSLPSFAGKSANPTVSLPFSISDILNGVDYVLITHLHPDHFDTKAQETISKSLPLVVQPSDLEKIKKFGFKMVEAIDQQKTLDNVKISRVEALHGEGKILSVMGTVSGYILEAENEAPLYITGDTIWCDSIKSTLDKFNPGIIVCNAGGNVFLPENNPFEEYISLERVHKVIMDEKQVLELLTYKKDTIVVTVHIGALDHETVTRKSMKEYLENHLVNMNRVFVPEDGETIEL